MVFFFFSSRRRHTRSTRDWSSDVCSSDLSQRPARSSRCIEERAGAVVRLLRRIGRGAAPSGAAHHPGLRRAQDADGRATRTAGVKRHGKWPRSKEFAAGCTSEQFYRSYGIETDWSKEGFVALFSFFVVDCGNETITYDHREEAS